MALDEVVLVFVIFPSKKVLYGYTDEYGTIWVSPYQQIQNIPNDAFKPIGVL